MKVSIKSVGPHRRRAGLAFSSHARTIDTSELTEDQLKAIQDDPELKIGPAPEESEGEGEPPSKAAAKGALKKAAK